MLASFEVASLSKREREVFELLADGLSGAEIAEALVLSPETVRTHIRNAMGKLGASTRSQAVVIALRRREIAPRSEAGGPPDRRLPPEGAAPETEDPTEPLEAVLDALHSLWDVDAGWIYLTDADGLGLRRVAARGGAQADVPATVALGEGPLGRVALDRRPQIAVAPAGQTGAMIIAPMLDGYRLVGVLALAARPSRAIDRAELLLLQALAARLGELVQAGGAQMKPGVERALAGFRNSWTATSRAL